MELVDAVWRGVPDFRESYELPDGLYRRNVAAFDEKVLRELLVNALVHLPYTQRNDIFVNLHPDRLDVVNPGRLPLGVTPQTAWTAHGLRPRRPGLALPNAQWPASPAPQRQPRPGSSRASCRSSWRAPAG